MINEGTGETLKGLLKIAEAGGRAMDLQCKVCHALVGVWDNLA